MPNLNLFTISGLAIVITYIPMMYCIIQDKKNKKRFIPYIIHLTNICLWGVGSICIGLATSIEQANTAWKWAYITVILIPNSFCFAVYSLNGQRNKFSLLLNVTGTLLIILALTGNLLGDARIIHDSIYYAKATPLLSLHLIIWSLTFFAGHLVVLNFYKKRINPDQNLFLLIVTPIGLIGGYINFFLLYKDNALPIGNFLIALYAATVTYAILRHQFLNIQVIIKKSIVYSALISIISIGYLIAVLISEKFLQNLVGYQSIMISGILTFTLGVLLIPFKNIIDSFVTRHLFKGSPEELAGRIDHYDRELQQREKYKLAAALTGSVAHEIKNPLTAISTFIEQFPHKKNDPDFLDKFHALASKELTRIQKLSLQLTDFSKPEQLQVSRFDIHEPLNDTLLLIDTRLRHRGITLRKTWTASECHIQADQNQIKQVFLNLILNAIDAMPDGGTISVETSVSDEMIHVRISDTGHGISDENLKNLFQPFFTTKKDGTGLGLSICKRIIESHEGRIEAFSQPGQGTTFVASLPLTNIQSEANHA